MPSSSLQTADFPAPDAAAQAHSLALVDEMRRIAAPLGGRLPFDRFMELALYAPGLGYYTAGARKFGAGGDFVTAPEISPLFGGCLARQAAQILDALNGGDLLEFGAGSGALARDLLLELQRLDALPERYLILELSPDLRQRQAERLNELPAALRARVQWLDALPQTPIRGLALANEVLDAMPVHRFRKAADVIEEQFVDLSAESPALVWAPPVSPELEPAVTAIEAELGAPLPVDYESEINLRAGPWLSALGQTLEAGGALLIDYGYPRQEYYLPHRRHGALMCHYRHRAHSDPLAFPGLQDITAHLDFSAITAAAREAGFDIAGYATQSSFLMGCGLDQLLARQDPDTPEYLELTQGVKQIMLPGAMGERFQALGLNKDLDLRWSGFSVRDLQGRL